jgi:large subunit ribosomal protein L34
MLCLRCSRGVSAFSIPSIAPRAVQNSPLRASAQRYAIPTLFQARTNLIGYRSFTSLAPRRPTIFPSSLRPSFAASPSATPTGASAAAPLDLLPKISTHPALGATQIRCGPRNTFSPSHFVRKRRHGFLSRNRTRKGRATLLRRRLKRRTTLSH